MSGKDQKAVDANPANASTSGADNRTEEERENDLLYPKGPTQRREKKQSAGRNAAWRLVNRALRCMGNLETELRDADRAGETISSLKARKDYIKELRANFNTGFGKLNKDEFLSEDEENTMDQTYDTYMKARMSCEAMVNDRMAELLVIQPLPQANPGNVSESDAEMVNVCEIRPSTIQPQQALATGTGEDIARPTIGVPSETIRMRVKSETIQIDDSPPRVQQQRAGRDAVEEQRRRDKEIRGSPPGIRCVRPSDVLTTSNVDDGASTSFDVRVIRNWNDNRKGMPSGERGPVSRGNPSGQTASQGERDRPSLRNGADWERFQAIVKSFRLSVCDYGQEVMQQPSATRLKTREEFIRQQWDRFSGQYEELLVNIRIDGPLVDEMERQFRDVRTLYLDASAQLKMAIEDMERHRAHTAAGEDDSRVSAPSTSRRSVKERLGTRVFGRRDPSLESQSESDQTLLPCKGCRGEQGQHHILHCPRFNSLDAFKRLRLSMNNHLCQICLEPGHNVHQCKEPRCSKCNKLHHELLHQD